MEKNAYVLNDNAMSHQTQSPRHEGFLFHNLCSWALSLITTDRINLRNQHSFFIFVLFWFFFPPFSVMIPFTICSSTSLMGDTCSFNQGAHVSTTLRTFQTENQCFFCIWSVHFLKGIHVFLSKSHYRKFIFWYLHKKATLKPMSFLHPRIKAPLLV